MKRTITRENIWEAANKLAAEGVMPSNIKVRNIIGEGCSDTILNKHLGEWKDLLLQKNNEAYQVHSELQAELEDLRERSAVWAEAFHRQTAIIKQLREALNAMLGAKDLDKGAAEVVRILGNESTN